MSVGRAADLAVDELKLIGGKSSIEAKLLSDAAAAAGLRVRWIDFDSPEAQARVAAAGPGSIRLPLVIIGDGFPLQRPSFAQVAERLSSIHAINPADRRLSKHVGEDDTGHGSGL